MRINLYSTINNTPYGAGQSTKKTSALSEKTTAQEQTGTDIAVKVDISEQARINSREFQTHDEKSFLKQDEAFFSQEVREKSKSDFASRLNRSVEIDPFDNEFQILAVHMI